MRLIDADALHNFVSEEFKDDVPYEWAWALTAVDCAPAVDAAPVVRCRDCVHWKPTKSKAGNSFSDMEYIGGCEFVYYCLRESDFCSYGERKDGDSNAQE